MNSREFPGEMMFTQKIFEPRVYPGINHEVTKVRRKEGRDQRAVYGVP
jgi:hypothetical protein